MKNKWPEPEVDRPTEEELVELMRASLFDESPYNPTSCGEYCEVEPDGVCPHGHPSWIMRAGMI